MNKGIWNLAFWKKTSNKALRTFAQTAVGLITVGVGLESINWLYVLSVSAVAAVVCVFMDISQQPLADDPSLNTGTEEAAVEPTVVPAVSLLKFKDDAVAAEKTMDTLPTQGRHILEVKDN